MCGVLHAGLCEFVIQDRESTPSPVPWSPTRLGAKQHSGPDFCIIPETHIICTRGVRQWVERTEFFWVAAIHWIAVG